VRRLQTLIGGINLSGMAKKGNTGKGICYREGQHQLTHLGHTAFGDTLRARPRSIFISHSHRDTDHPIFRRLIADLRGIPNLKLWLDDEQIHDGQLLFGALNAAIRQADFVLHVVSAGSAQSRWTNHEAMIALADQASRQQARILLVRIDDVHMPRELTPIAFTDLVHDYDLGFELLVQTILAQPARLLARIV
jgi:hypothetical protein